MGRGGDRGPSQQSVHVNVVTGFLKLAGEFRFPRAGFVKLCNEHSVVVGKIFNISLLKGHHLFTTKEPNKVAILKEDVLARPQPEFAGSRPVSTFIITGQNNHGKAYLRVFLQFLDNGLRLVWSLVQNHGLKLQFFKKPSQLQFEFRSMAVDNKDFLAVDLPRKTHRSLLQLQLCLLLFLELFLDK